MIDPYKMVVINLISSTILLCGIFLYRYIIPKKRINLFILLILFSLPPLISILRKGSYESGDMSLHAKFAMDFYKNLTEGNFIPRVSSTIFAGHACPDFIFMYPLPYYIVSFFHFIGFSFINSVKLLLAFTYIGSGILIYQWIKDELGIKPAFVAAVFYLYAPYHLINMHFRVDIAEMCSFATLPLCFLSARKVIQTKKFLWFFINGIALCLLILSHQAISLFSFPFIIAYAIFEWLKIKKKNINNLIYYFFSVIVGVSLASYYWLTIIVERKYIYWGSNPTTFFPELLTFIYSPWRFGLLFQGPMGELRTIVGYIQLLIVIFSTIIIIKSELVSNIIILILKLFNKFTRPGKKSSLIDTEIKIKPKNKIILLFFLSSFYIVFIMMQSISAPLWKIIPLIINTQISSRLLILSSLFSSVIAGILTKEIKNKYFIMIICFLAIFPTILNWGNRGTYPTIDDNYLRDEMINKGGFTGIDFTTPIWVSDKASWINQPSKYPIEIITGEANITQIYRSSTKHEYLIQVNKNTVFRENTFYFPGWVLKINNKNYPIEFKNPKYSGLMLFNLNKGIYKVEIIFLDTPVRSISKIVSFLTFLSLLIYLLIFKLPGFFSQRFR